MTWTAAFAEASAPRWGRVAAALLVATVIAVVAFVFRFNNLGGTLGGFDNDHFVHLLRADMLLNGEQPLRDFAEAELRGAWPSLGYAMSVWAQQVWGPTLLAEGYLTVGTLALAAAGAFLLSLHLSQRWLVSLLAAACVIVSEPKLYNYEKVLVLFVGALLVRLWIVRPSHLRLAALSAWTSIAILFRHDFGVYVAVAAAAALLARGPASIAARGRRVAAYAAISLLFLLPSIVWIQTYAGITTYAQRTLETVQMESARTRLVRPAFEPGAGLSVPNLIAATYYAFWMIPAAALGVLVWLRRRNVLEPDAMATGLALLVCAVAVNMFFLRGNLLARFGDAIVPVALLAAWTAGQVRLRQGYGPAMLWVLPRAAMLVMLPAMFVGGEVQAELHAAGMSQSWEATGKQFQRAHAGLSQLPPDAWTDALSQGTLVAARYLAECTGPDDRVLLATYAPQVPVFARRRFAAGQGTFGLAFYESEAQQREAVARLQQQSVPVVLGSYEEFEGEFVADYRHVSRFVADRYDEAGVLYAEGRPLYRVFVARDREPRRVHPQLGLPCFK